MENKSNCWVETLSGNVAPGHQCSGIGCEVCAEADQKAAHTKLETWRTARGTKKINPRGRKSVIEDRQPVYTRTITHVTPDLPPAKGNLNMGSSANQVTAFLPETKVDDPHELADVTLAKGFILAGNAYFTIRSKKTGTRYTYRVSRADCRRCGEKDCHCWVFPLYFVSVLTGSDNTADYTYLGMIADQQMFKGTKKTFETKRDQWPSFKAFEWTWNRMVTAQRIPETVEVWHEGRCGRCGRALTVPESIANGIGPVCEGLL